MELHFRIPSARGLEDACSLLELYPSYHFSARHPSPGLTSSSCPLLFFVHLFPLSCSTSYLLFPRLPLSLSSPSLPFPPLSCPPSPSSWAHSCVSFSLLALPIPISHLHANQVGFPCTGMDETGEYKFSNHCAFKEGGLCSCPSLPTACWYCSPVSPRLCSSVISK